MSARGGYISEAGIFVPVAPEPMVAGLLRCMCGQLHVAGHPIFGDTGHGSVPIIRPDFPDPATCPIIAGRGARYYRTPGGDYPSVTSLLRVLGLSTNALVAWSAREERKAVLEACADVYAEGVDGGPSDFAAAVEARIGHAKQHQKLITKAADIGTAIHQEIQRRPRIMLGLPAASEEVLPDSVTWAVLSWGEFMEKSGLRPFLCEQPVWDPMGFAGTVDLLAYDSDGRLGILDWKSAKGVYEDHHIQVAAYAHAARNFADIQWAQIVRVPKNVDDPAFEVRDLGDLGQGKRLSEAKLFEAFSGALKVWYALNGEAA